MDKENDDDDDGVLMEEKEGGCNTEEDDALAVGIEADVDTDVIAEENVTVIADDIVWLCVGRIFDPDRDDVLVAEMFSKDAE